MWIWWTGSVDGAIGMAIRSASLRGTSIWEHLMKLNSLPVSVLSVVLAALIGAGFTATPANAAAKQQAPSPDTVQSTVGLEYLGFDERTAKANGYDIRTDKHGVKYSIPSSTPKGVTEGAIYIPGTKRPEPGEIVTRDTIYGNCGTATLTGTGQGCPDNGPPNGRLRSKETSSSICWSFSAQVSSSKSGNVVGSDTRHESWLGGA